jgi:hypothetical protein
MNKNSDQSLANATQLATLTANVTTMSRDINDIKEDIKDLKGQYVTTDQFFPIRNLVYGFVTLILIAVIGAIISFFVLTPPTRVTVSNGATVQSSK